MESAWTSRYFQVRVSKIQIGTGRKVGRNMALNHKNREERIAKLKRIIKGNQAWVDQAQQNIRHWKVELKLLELGSLDISTKVRHDPELAAQLAEEMGIE